MGELHKIEKQLKFEDFVFPCGQLNKKKKDIIISLLKIALIFRMGN